MDEGRDVQDQDGWMDGWKAGQSYGLGGLCMWAAWTLKHPTRALRE